MKAPTEQIYGKATPPKSAKFPENSNL